MNSCLSKLHEMSDLSYRLTFTITSDENYGQVKVMKCPPGLTPQSGRHSKPNPNLIKFTDMKANPNVKKVIYTLI